MERHSKKTTASQWSGIFAFCVYVSIEFGWKTKKRGDRGYGEISSKFPRPPGPPSLDRANEDGQFWPTESIRLRVCSSMPPARSLAI